MSHHGLQGSVGGSATATGADAGHLQEEDRPAAETEPVRAPEVTTSPHVETGQAGRVSHGPSAPVSTGAAVEGRTVVPGRNARGRFTRGNALALRRAVPQATFDAVRADIAAGATGCRLPDAIKSVLVDEATHLTIATQTLLGSLDRGLLSKRAKPRPQFASYLELVARLEKVADLLGLFDAPTTASGVPAAVLKRLTPATRAAIAQRGRS